jgi:hypothetical protein
MMADVKFPMFADKTLLPIQLTGNCSSSHALFLAKESPVLVRTKPPCNRILTKLCEEVGNLSAGVANFCDNVHKSCCEQVYTS